MFCIHNQHSHSSRVRAAEVILSVRTSLSHGELLVEIVAALLVPVQLPQSYISEIDLLQFRLPSEITTIFD